VRSVTVLVGFVVLLAPAVGEAGGSQARGQKDTGAVTALRLARNGPLAIVSAKPPDSPSGGLYEVGRNGLGDSVFRCGGSTPCWELEGAAWAPDGERLAYGAESLGGNPVINGLYVLDLATGKSRQIRPFKRSSGYGGWYEIAWSPNGKRIAYVSREFQGASRIVIVDADGSHATILATGDAQFAGWPSWSPDGTRIAYATTRVADRGEPTAPVDGSIYVIRSDGTQRQLIAEHGTAPAWSPDGTRIAYLTGCGPPPFRPTRPTGIRLVTPVGRDVTKPTANAGCATVGVAGAPVWSPDATKIALANTTGVYVMDADGGNLVQLTTAAPTSISSNHLSWMRPAWQPLPRRR
jgi:Tol biopolymer transport system component